jgi:tetratricopeptide (TPR) repeat protein
MEFGSGEGRLGGVVSITDADDIRDGNLANALLDHLSPLRRRKSSSDIIFAAISLHWCAEGSVMSSTRHFCVACIAFGLVALIAHAQTNWVGRTILVKKPGIKIGNTDDEGNLVQIATLDEMDYRVLEEQPGRIKVKTRHGIPGWFDKSDAVPLEQAIAFFTERIHADASDADAYCRRGWSWHIKDDLDKAIKDFDEAVRLDPRAFAFINRGVALGRKGEFDKAIADFNEAIRVDPRHVMAYNNRGLAWEGKKQLDKAIADFSQAIRLDAKYALLYFNRANVLYTQKEFGKALADLDETTRLDPTDASAHNNRAWLLATCPEAKYRDGKLAVESAKKALSLDKQSGNVMGTLAAAYAEAGDFTEAIRWQLRAMEDPALKNDEDSRRRLELYRNKMPYREE